MRNLLINLLFRLLGNSKSNLYNINYLFGASTSNHEARKKKWERALARLYRDKDMLDFLYYQAESDKEIVFRRKSKADLSKGARIRTLFLVYSARIAYEEGLKGRKTSAQEKSENDTEIKSVQKAYKNIVDVE